MYTEMISQHNIMFAVISGISRNWLCFRVLSRRCIKNTGHFFRKCEEMCSYNYCHMTSLKSSSFSFSMYMRKMGGQVPKMKTMSQLLHQHKRLHRYTLCMPTHNFTWLNHMTLIMSTRPPIFLMFICIQQLNRRT